MARLRVSSHVASKPWQKEKKKEERKEEVDLSFFSSEQQRKMCFLSRELSLTASPSAGNIQALSGVDAIKWTDH